MASGDSVQLIKEKLSVVDVISPYVELHKAGKNLKGRSPFTNEKTPSFYVSPERGMYYCFSSSQGGDIFTFVQKMEGVDFKGALKILADKAGVELVPEDPKKRDERDTLYLVLEEATRFFEEQLKQKSEAVEYLKNRATTDDTINTWRIGYAPNDWRQLREHLNAKGYSDEVLLKAGLIKQPEGGKQPYDVFRDRIMFPIMDPSSRVVGFSGRLLSKDSEAPKYVNSPETALFNKSEILFGYDKAKQGIYKLEFSLIVEGQFDVILAHQSGYNNTVAVSGTSLTPGHVSILQRLSNKVVLALDNDRAGIAAVKRAAELMLVRGVDLKVARLHGGKDPADLVKEDPKLLRKDIGNSKHVIEFLLDLLQESTKDERTKRLKARDEILPFVMMIESPIERDHFAGIIADAVGTTVDAIRLELTRLENINKDKRTETEDKPTSTREETTQKKPDSDHRKKDLLFYLAMLEDLIPQAEAHMLSERFIKVTEKSPSEVRGELTPEKSSELAFTLEQHINDLPPRYLRDEWESKLNQLQKLLTKEKINKAKLALAEAEQAGDEETKNSCIKEIDELRVKLNVE